MLTHELAANLVAIGMADFICRLNQSAFHCCINHHKEGCCQEQLLDTMSVILLALGKDQWAT